MRFFYPLIFSLAVSSATPLQPMPKSTEVQKRQTCGTYEELMLWNLNFHRSNHSSPDLVWNETLAAAAKVTTEKDVLAHDNNGTGWGQNLFNWYSSDPTDYRLMGVGAIDSWYNHEFRNYDTYGEASMLDLKNKPNDVWPEPAVPGGVYGHFTQCIWKSSQSVGCATTNKVLDNGTPGTWTACNFYPPGNWITADDSWVVNVLPPLGYDVVNLICPPAAP